MNRGYSYKFSALPSSGDIRVWKVPVRFVNKGGSSGVAASLGYSADLPNGAFVEDLDPSEGAVCEEHILPAGLYSGEFLSLDPFDLDDLIDFQSRHGLIIGARDNTLPLSETQIRRLDPAPNSQAFCEAYGAHRFGGQQQGINRSKEYFTELGDQGVMVSSIEEVVSTVLNAQQVIVGTINLLKSPEEAISSEDLKEAKAGVNFASAVLSQWLKPLDLVYEDSIKTRYCDLMTAIFLQLARGLINGNGYRYCQNPECGLLFTPSDFNRRSDSGYHSVECQERAKYLRLKRKKELLEKK